MKTLDVLEFALRRAWVELDYAHDRLGPDRKFVRESTFADMRRALNMIDEIRAGSRELN